MRRSPAKAGLHAAPSLVDVDKPLRLVHVGSDDAVGTRAAARMFVAVDGGPLRTIVGDAHSHWTGEEHSKKTGLSNPYEGPTEHALIVESELRSDVLTYRTQAFRLQLMVGTGVEQWICDHPLANEDILFNLGMARGVASDTKVRTFPHVKIKWDPRDLGHAWLFDELNREFVKIPCTRRRYATGLPFWLHLRIKKWAKDKKKKFDTDFEMAAVREEYTKWFSRILPKANAADQHATARLIDSSEGRRFLGDAIQLLKIKSSPSGMESQVPHDDRVSSRGDATRIAPRSSNRRDDGKPRDRRGKGNAPDPAQTDREDVAKFQTRRTGFSSGWD